MKLAYLLIICFLNLHVIGQYCATSENGRLEAHIIKKTKLNSSGLAGKIKSKNSVLLLDNEFKDSIVVYLNDSQIYKGFAKTGFSSGITDVQIPLSFEARKKYVLRILLLNTNECMSAELKTKFKAIHIYKSIEWHIQYTNYRFILE